MSRIKRGWGLTKKSWALLNGHRELIRFPLYGAIATVPLAILFFGPGLYLLDKDSLAGAIPLLVIGVYVLSVVGFYFSVGLAAAANMIFNGERATIADGLAVSRANFSQICGWAALSTAISVLMGVLENQGGIAGNIAARLVGMAWSLVTFLAVPVIAIEGTGPLETLKRSASIFKDKWGQQISGNTALAAAAFLRGGRRRRRRRLHRGGAGVGGEGEEGRPQRAADGDARHGLGPAVPELEVRGLTKRYGRTVAVDDLSFAVEAGRVTGFLGPNGAGKTTTMRALLGLLRPSGGDALVEGSPPAGMGGRPPGEMGAPLRTIGAAREATAFPPGRSGRNHLRTLAAAAAIPRARVEEGLEMVELTGAADRRAKGYSLGMRQRLA